MARPMRSALSGLTTRGRSFLAAGLACALCAGAFSSVELLGVFHARKLRMHELALRAGWDSIHPRLGLTKRFYGRFTPAISERDFRIGQGNLDKALDFLAVLKP